MRDLSKKGLRILVIQDFNRLEVNPTLNPTTKDVVTILLVEDTEDNRQMMRRLLEMSGYRVVEATNGKEAIEAASLEHPQAILMDLSLPLIDGLAATRRIRSLPGLRKVPILAVSAHDTADFHSEALAAGCDAYITKPIDYPELEDIVKRLLAANR